MHRAPPQFEHMIEKGTVFEKRAQSPPRVEGFTAMYTGGAAERRRAQAAERLKEKRKNEKVMAGRKRDLRLMVMLFKKYVGTYYKIKVDEVGLGIGIRD